MRNIAILILLILNLSVFCFVQIAQGEPAKTLDGFYLVQYETAGEKKWELNGLSAEIGEDTIRIKEPSAVAFGRPAGLKLKARQGDFDPKIQLVHFWNNVVVKTTDGIKLTTDSLYWNAENRNIFTDESVNMKFSASTRQTTITCSGMFDLNYKKNCATFYDDVRLKDSEGDVFADRLDIYFTNLAERITSVVAQGNVKITREGSSTYSEKAIYLVDEGRLILPERPKLVVVNKNAE